MTPLTSEITRESSTIVNDSTNGERALIATLAPHKDGDCISLRLKGCKRVWAVSLADVWRLTQAAPVGICPDCLDKLEETIKE
jgi:hypothetical protein